MSDRFPAAIQIGGPVPAQLVEAIAFAQISLEWGGATFEPATIDDLIANLDPTTHLLHLYDEQARGGIFDSLETWLRDHSVSYDRQSDARYEFDGMAVSFRPEIGEVTRTATQKRLRIPMPKDLVDILRAHMARLPLGPMTESDLLFPSDTGGFRSASTLDKPFARITKAAGIKKHITPYSMRRTFQDLGRQAQVHDFVVRAISGHSTVEMQQHYSTVDGAEVRAGLAKVISLAGFAKAAPQKPSGGDAGGYQGSAGSKESEIVKEGDAANA